MAIELDRALLEPAVPLGDGFGAADALTAMAYSRAISLKRIAAALETIARNSQPLSQADLSKLFNPDGTPRSILDTVRTQT